MGIGNNKNKMSIQPKVEFPNEPGNQSQIYNPDAIKEDVFYSIMDRLEVMQGSKRLCVYNSYPRCGNTFNLTQNTTNHTNSPPSENKKVEPKSKPENEELKILKMFLVGVVIITLLFVFV